MGRLSHDYWGNTPPINKPSFINPGLTLTPSRCLGDIRRSLGLHRDHRGLPAAAVREALGDLLVLTITGQGKTLFGEFLGKCGGKNGGIAMFFVISWWVLI